ncbi:head-tail adaptor protein [Paracraurococcus ruber]|uniref:Head-tail adaptor protein n=1 Tax=Paracraurococcus ruber TaxID=77675 RepID=A0ABS1CQX8_9PROT|nr:head-tail adaptor protein [Paracraurococcus ruber]MBK1656847.1 hypothetical protein [Paracraurococcus ruber]TDG33962.1 head-tail adaptor protein [Paracraurococcus ruber]
MGAGELRHRLVLEQRAQEADAGTGLAETYTAVAEVWAKIEASKGALYIERVQVGEGPTHRITIRWRPGTGFTHCRDLAGRRWRVRDVRDMDGDRRWLVIGAEELTA